jgi:predicted nucleic acid-binding protein
VAPELFVDTSAWYPAVVSSHPDHATVAAEMAERVQRGVRIVTTNLIVGETHALLLHRSGRKAALRFVQTVREPPILIVASSAELERDAVAQWLERFADQDFSFADAVSFAVMKVRKIREALTLDAHFAVAGFARVPGARRSR